MLHWYIVAAAYPQVCAVLIIVKWCGLHGNGLIFLCNLAVQKLNMRVGFLQLG